MQLIRQVVDAYTHLIVLSRRHQVSCLRAAHAPYEPEMIAVSSTELKRAFESMPYMRDRITAVDLLHRLGLMPDVSRFLFGPGGRWEVK